MRRAPFRFATDILRRLGEELNPSLDQGVLELVKNAHDADATWCEVRLDDVGRVGGSLKVADDGDGMTADDVVDQFLLLGKSDKVGKGLTKRGRILAGSKGLGRLAALRSGRVASLSTRPASEPELEHRLVIDWSLFDRTDTVDAVEFDLASKSRATGVSSGTTIEVKGLTRPIGRMEVKRLARSLLLLSYPFDDDPSAFRPSLDAPEFRDLTELTKKKYFEDAEYHLRATVDTGGYATGEVIDWRREVLFSAAHGDLRRSNGPYRCPAVEFDLWVFILNAKTFQTRSASVGEVKKWLAEFGGVMLYLNGIRVSPYGDPNNDWLDMNLQRTRNPEERPGTNTSLGRMRVTDESGLLEAKTDRSGLIEGAAFNDLREFAQDALNWMAGQRLRQAERRRQAKRTTAPTQSSRTKADVEQVIETVGATKPDLQRAFGKYDRAREREVTALREEVQLYRTLSTAGITAATFAHEASGGPLKVIGRAVATVRRRLEGCLAPVPQRIGEPLDRIESSALSLGAFSDTTLELVDRDKRRASRVDVHKVVSELVQVYEPFMEAREARVELRLAVAEPFLRGSVAAIESIVVNLLTNALTSLANSAAETRLVGISTTIEPDWLELTVDDNGPGVVEFDISEIWLPGVTSRQGGSGLGLTIVRDTAADLGGEANAMANGPLGGAHFRVRIPIIGA